MGFNFGATQTVNGYRLDEAVSTLQKACRRSHEDYALFFGLEILSTQYKDYAWKRLLIIASEDIGLAGGIGFFGKIHSLYTSWRFDKDQNHFVEAIALLARSPKSRLAVHAAISGLNNGLSYVEHDWFVNNSDIEYLFRESLRLQDEPNSLYFGLKLFSDKRTMAGWDIIGSPDFDHPLENYASVVSDLSALFDYWKVLNKKGDAAESLMFTHAILTICRMDSLAIADLTFDISQIEIPESLEVPDWGLDCHTQRGRKLKRGTVHFYNEAGLLIPPSPITDVYEEIAKTVEGYYGTIPKKEPDSRFKPTNIDLESVVPKEDILPLLAYM